MNAPESRLDTPRATQLQTFAERAGRVAGRPLNTYDDLWQWSVADPGAFWCTVWDTVGLPARNRRSSALSGAMPHARWFEGTEVNYASDMFRDKPASSVALTVVDEDGTIERLTWAELRQQVASCARWLRAAGVGRGESVVAYLPNSAEAVVAFLASASVGATWALCGLDYAGEAALARLGQLRPKALIVARTAVHGGRLIDRTADVELLRAGLHDVVATAIVGGEPQTPQEQCFDTVTADAGATWEPIAVPFEHPLWVLFTSGTTGKPKGLVHGHGGILLEQRKFGHLHLDLEPDDRVLWYTSPSWMMWNFVLGALLCGAEIVCYDGSAGHPHVDRLWRLAADLGVTVLGTSPGYLSACRSADVDLGSFATDRLRLLGVTGSAFAVDLHQWAARSLGDRVEIASTSGGTDVCTAFVGHYPGATVVPGELSAPCLGVDLRSLSVDGTPVVGQAGELVIAAPMPSMPLHFWDDASGERYRAAYFDAYPGLWCHGDSITVTRRGSVVIHGRSDATLNRQGVRMGSGDVTGPAEQLPEVAEAMVIGVEEASGGYYMPLFVKLAEQDAELDEELAARIRSAIRDATSPRHVPDAVIAAPGIPHSRTGKKLEVPIRRIFLGVDAEDALDRGSVDDPALIDWYVEQARALRR